MGSTVGEMLWEEDQLCHTCRGKWIRAGSGHRFSGCRTEILYLYNQDTASVLLQYKEMGDEALKDVFLCRDRKRLSLKYRGSTLVLMPSREEKVRERGFPHLRKMFEQLDLPMLDCFEKTDPRDQKELSYEERQTIVLKLKNVTLPEKIVLVDDVITTGATMRAALSCVKDRCGSVRILAVFAVAGEHGIS